MHDKHASEPEKYCCPVCLDTYDKLLSHKLECGHFMCPLCTKSQRVVGKERLKHNLRYGTSYEYHLCPYRCASTLLQLNYENGYDDDDDETGDRGCRTWTCSRVICLSVTAAGIFGSVAYTFGTLLFTPAPESA